MEDLGCAKEKCVKVLAELDSKKRYWSDREKKAGIRETGYYLCQKLCHFGSGQRAGKPAEKSFKY